MAKSTKDHKKTREPVWHYTTVYEVEEILSVEEIKPTTELAVEWEDEPKAVRLSANQNFEKFILPLQVMEVTGYGEEAHVEWVKYPRPTPFEDVMTNGGGFVRIGIDPEAKLHCWDEYKQLSGIPEDVAKKIEYTATYFRRSVPSEWWFSFKPLPISTWIELAVFDTGTKWWTSLYNRYGYSLEQFKQDVEVTDCLPYRKD